MGAVTRSVGAPAPAVACGARGGARSAMAGKGPLHARRPTPGRQARRLLGVGLLAVVLAAGCAALREERPAPREEPTTIIDFLTIETEAALTVVIRGSRPLTYTALEQDSPPRVMLQFPATGLKDLAAVYHPPENAVLSAIRAVRSGDGVAETRITIDLKREIRYSVKSAGDDLHIVFDKPPDRPTPQAAKTAPLKAKAAPKLPARPGAATTVTDLSVATGPGGVAIRVAADGTVGDFVSFTLNNPARCVVDLNHMGSRAKGEQRQVVDSPFVKEVRYFAHPDKVRVVLETTSDHLGSCVATGTENGLIVTIGRPPSPAPPSRPEAEPAPQRRTEGSGE